MVQGKPRVGVFGVGRMGRIHVENLVRLHLENRIELAGLGDRYAPALDSTTALVEQLAGSELSQHMEKFSCPQTMAEQNRLDAVVVASRIADHFQDVLAFASHKVPVLVEKPIMATVGQAAQLVDALGQENTGGIQVGFQRHHDPAARAASEWYRQGLIGELQHSHHVIQDKNPPPAGYLSGGITADMAVHLVFESMSFHGFELPRWVQALRFCAPHYEDRAQEGANIVHVFLSWDDGSMAHLWGSRLNATGYDNGFKLIGTAGRIDVGEFVGDFGPIQAKLWQGTGSGPVARGTLVESLEFPMTQPAAHHPDFYARYAVAFADELIAFLQQVQQREPFELGIDVGWKTILVANLADMSALKQGQRIELRLDGAPISSVQTAAEFARKIGLE